MTFLGVAFLFAVPLAAAPLLLHLLDRRRNVAIEWGAMDFLVSASTRQTSARRLKQWTLLLLRMLAIAALIFALARPLIPSGWLGTSDRGETIFVVDNSMSTGRSDGEQTLMQSILKRAEQEVSELTPGDRVRVLTTAPYPIWQGDGGSQSGGFRFDPGVDESAEQPTWQGIQPTHGRSDLLAGLMTAVQADSDPTTVRRRIVLLTDSQAADWRMEDMEGWNLFRQRLSKPTIDTQLQIIQVARDGTSRGNVAVDEVRAKRTRVGMDEPIALTATIRNHHGRAASAARRIEWEVDGEPMFDGLVESMDANSSREATWAFSFDTPGAHRITARIAGEDDLAADDAASLIVDVVAEVPILIVEGESRLAESQQDSFFVRAALGWLDEQPRAGRAVFAPTVVSDQRLASIDLSQFHVVLVPNLKELDHGTLQSLTQFVSDGGGLWAALGPRTDVDAFNSHWFAGGSGLSPVALDRVVTESQRDLPVTETEDSAAESRPPVTINPFGSRHEAVTQLADNQHLDLGDVVVDHRYRFSIDEADNRTSVLLTLSNGDPVVVEQLLGRGRVVIQAIPLGMQWSDLVRSQAFVVMVRDWVDYLSQPRATQFNLQPGDPIVYRIGEVDGSLTGMLTTPQNEAIELVADGFGEAVLRTSRTSFPGSYQLETNLAGDAIPFQVARDIRESDLSPLDASQQKQLSGLVGIQATVGDRSTASSDPTDPLWPSILMVLIGLITLELLLSGMLARERFGVAGLSENTSALDSSLETEIFIPETKFPAVSGLGSHATKNEAVVSTTPEEVSV